MLKIPVAEIKLRGCLEIGSYVKGELIYDGMSLADILLEELAKWFFRFYDFDGSGGVPGVSLEMPVASLFPLLLFLAMI